MRAYDNSLGVLASATAQLRLRSPGEPSGGTLASATAQLLPVAPREAARRGRSVLS
ncbi:hypothetical protein Raf01_85250 [Rugosimonospora africana]|uniref:Uncharacterized protein n=1 Tax=Rugosimonospora africana TaxID=556532 RepID=A0A8J3VW47_9ACTN|nr:hypothetical protein Raf01_85250 [Rugosimonospora africana]